MTVEAPSFRIQTVDLNRKSTGRHAFPEILYTAGQRLCCHAYIGRIPKHRSTVFSQFYGPRPINLFLN